MTEQVSPRQPRMSRRLLSHTHHSRSRDYARGPLRMRVDTLPGIRVLAVAGELDLATAPLLHEAVRAGERFPATVVDTSRLAFVGLAGVDVLIGAAERAEGEDRLFAAVVSSRPTQRAFELSGAAAWIRCYPRLGSALAAVSRS
ncbi:STAS domain-containing protein [Nocardia brasiliensis]|uniref:STAS domain-containing protein n=1 Tax=Nocardia brasiliensis TaxID=37326 RepID=A0A6G9XS89_NOCBR|nr:STAS domain-containing protein [Nocardia brasiliensis]QIS03784.1 STAS domain-containing protein [Nocardia brasiliensis]